MNKRVLGVVLIVIAIGMIIAGGYIGSQDKSYNDVLNKDIKADNKNIKVDFEAEKKYINEKYNDTFTVEKLISTYYANTDDGLTFTSGVTNINSKITINIYKVKDKNNSDFYIKRVIHNDKNVNISKYEDLLSEGFYDNYLALKVGDKIKNNILSKYKATYNIKDLTINGGVGIFSDNDNQIMSHFPKTDDLKDLNISAKEFLTKISKHEFLSEFHDLSLVIEINDNVTKDNFQKEVEKFIKIKSLTLDNDLKVKKLVLKYNNNRTISEDYGIVLKENNKKIYDKNIIGYDKTIISSENPINYDDFKKIDKKVFNF